MADDLTIYLKLVNEGGGPAGGGAGGGGPTAAEAEAAKEEAAYVKAVKVKLRAAKEFHENILRHVKEEQSEQDKADQAYIRAVKLRERAIAQLHKQEEAEAKKAAAAAAAANRQAVREANEHQKAILNVSTAYTSLRIAAEANQAITFAIRSIAESAKDARDYIARIVDDMEKLRSRATEILAMRNQAPSAGKVAGLVKEAYETGVRLEPYLKGIETSQAYLAGQVGPGRRIPDNAKMASLNRRAISYAASQGIDTPSAARLLDIAVRKSARAADGSVDEEEVMNNYGKLLATMQLASGKTSPLLPQFAEVASELVGGGAEFKDVQEAGVLFRQMAQVNPQKASTFTRNLMRGMRKIHKSEEKMEELGIDRRAAPEDQIMQALAGIERIAKEEDIEEGDVMSRYFENERAFEGIRAAMAEGKRARGFEEARKDVAKMTPAEMARRLKEYQESPEGKAAKEETALQLEEARTAVGFEPLRQLQKRAATDIARTQALTQPETFWESITRGARQFLGYGGRKEQEERLRTLELLKPTAETPAGKAIIAEQPGSLNQFYSFMRNLIKGERLEGGAALTQELPEETMGRLARLAEQQLEESKRQTAIMRGNVAPPPVAPNMVPQVQGR